MNNVKYSVQKRFLFLFVLFATVLCLLKIITAFTATSSGQDSAALTDGEPVWADTVLCHAMGAIGTDTYTNSLEAFEASYQAGFRTFEVDLLMTSDGEVVLMHDWNKAMQPDFEKGYIPTLEEFLQAPILGKYTPLSFRDLLTIAVEHPDIYIVTDSKYTDLETVSAEFSKMLSDAESMDCTEVFDRFIVQLYREEMYDCINKIYPFNQYIFTLYQRWEGEDMEELEEICRWSVNTGVPSITMWSTFITEPVRETVQKHGLRLYGHTVDDPSEAAALLNENVGIYTNVITPREALSLTGD